MFLTVSAHIRIYEDTSRTIIVSGGLEVITLKANFNQVAYITE